MITIFFSPLSFVAVFGSGIRDKHPGSETLKKTTYRVVVESPNHDGVLWWRRQIIQLLLLVILVPAGVRQSAGRGLLTHQAVRVLRV